MNLKIAFVAAAAGNLALLPAADRPYSLYETILAKEPFGAVPENFDPAVNPGTIDPRSTGGGKTEVSPEQEQLQKSVAVSVLHIAPDRSVWVGFTDMSVPKSPKAHYLRVGESADGWEIKNADLATKKVVLAKQGVDIEVAVGDSGTATADAAKPGAAKEAESAAPRRSPLLDPANRPAAGVRSMASLRAARHGREDAMRREREELAADVKRQQEEMDRRHAEEAEREQAEAEERQERRQQLSAIAEEMRKLREAEEMRKLREAEEAQDGQPRAGAGEGGGEGEDENHDS